MVLGEPSDRFLLFSQVNRHTDQDGVDFVKVEVGADLLHVHRRRLVATVGEHPLDALGHLGGLSFPRPENRDNPRLAIMYGGIEDKVGHTTRIVNEEPSSLIPLPRCPSERFGNEAWIGPQTRRYFAGSHR